MEKGWPKKAVYLKEIFIRNTGMRERLIANVCLKKGHMKLGIFALL